jgi:hypothetical protein
MQVKDGMDQNSGNAEGVGWEGDSLEGYHRDGITGLLSRSVVHLIAVFRMNLASLCCQQDEWNLGQLDKWEQRKIWRREQVEASLRLSVSGLTST